MTKAFLTLLLLLLPGALWAQPAPPLAVYADARGRFQLSYPRAWQLSRNEGGAEVTFYVYGARHPALAVVTLAARALPEGQQDASLLAPGAQDTLWQRLRQLPRAQVRRLEQRDLGRYEEARYDYTYAPAGGASVHVLGRLLWRGGYEFRMEYRAEVRQDGEYRATGQQMLDSFAFTEAAFPSRRYADQRCDDKLYGIAAVRYADGQWEDDCRTIHEFSTSDLTAAPKVHRRVLPFQSYALAKGFDNCLYSVTKAPTDAPERVYRYDPATRQGAYTAWQLPAQGPENVWISAATDDRGDLYFLTSDANLLVKVSPGDGRVTPLWTTDPVQKAPYYPVIGFAGAGTHGNFCLDDAGTLYLVYSTDGSLLKVRLDLRQAYPERLPISGLPARGGYSDLLLQNDASGRRRMYLAGPHALYEVDLARRQASRVRKGTYTDLAGCNLFRLPPRPAAPPAPPATATWRGRVLDAATARPLPQALLRLRQPSGAGTALLLNTQGAFAYAGAPGRAYPYRAECAGYFPLDSTWAATPGPQVHDVLLRALAVGATLPLANVQFEQGQAVLLPTSFAALDPLVGLLLDNPGLTIELRGHTDNVGPPGRNVVLSEQRVAAVKAYLVGHGIGAGRIGGIGLGGAQPAASNEQEATRRLNRRVEFRVTGVQ